MNIIGHQKNIQSFIRLKSEDKIPHALLLTGPLGIGKKKVAWHFAQSLLCTEASPPCESCSACLKVQQRQHPDFIFIEPEEDVIKIDSIRHLKSQLSLQPFEAKFKIALIADAEAMNVAASNALLKTLEEPSEKTLLFLTSSAPYRLLKTILSRCQKMYFSPLRPEEIQSILVGRSIPVSSLLKEVESPGILLSIDEAALVLFEEKMLPSLQSHPKDLMTLLKSAEEISDEDSMQKTILYLLKKHWHRKILASPLPSEVKKIEAIEQAEKFLKMNANPLLTFENLFIQLCL
ncbi:MAG: DNA polymerase III subunit delta' [Deltaproteobacteria bacterium]|nr:DNA polymerase III subunit delta' [Deltaproteobacteria bacterium]